MRLPDLVNIFAATAGAMSITTLGDAILGCNVLCYLAPQGDVITEDLRSKKSGLIDRRRRDGKCNTLSNH